MKFGLARLDCCGWCFKSAALSSPGGPALPPIPREAPSHPVPQEGSAHLEPPLQGTEQPQTSQTSSEVHTMMCEGPKRFSCIVQRKSRAGEGSVQKQEVKAVNLGGSRDQGMLSRAELIPLEHLLNRDNCWGPGASSPAPSSSIKHSPQRVEHSGASCQEEESSGHKPCPL